MALPKDFNERLLATLKEKRVNPVCEICGHNDWAALDQAVSLQITDLSGTFSIPSPQIPSAGLVCNNCGNIRLFALGALGLLPKPDEEKSK